VTYSVTAPLAAGESGRPWYEAVNEVLLAALQSLGVPAEPAEVAGRTPAPGSASCFLRPDAGEISVSGRKLVGSALLREGNALLQHGSILIEDDQGMLAPFLPGDAMGGAAGTLHDALGHAPDWTVVARAIEFSLRDVVGETTELVVDTRLEQDAVDASARYESDDWTFLR
jgi:lipoate-protein ligase A